MNSLFARNMYLGDKELNALTKASFVEVLASIGGSYVKMH